MKLDRNINADGAGKYALLNLRRLPYHLQSRDPERLGVAAVRHPEAVEVGVVGTESEFFVIKLKDRYAEAALLAYAAAAEADDPEWATEVRGVAARSGPHHPNCKTPD